MKATVIEVKKKGTSLLVTSEVVGKGGEILERKNKARLSLSDALAEVIGEEVNLQVKKDEDTDQYVITGVGEYENERKGSYGGNKGGYKKGGYTGGSSGAKSTYDNTGQQVGNVITNSIAILGAGHTIAEYEKTALELIAMGNRIRVIADTKPKSIKAESADYEDDEEEEVVVKKKKKRVVEEEDDDEVI